MDATHCNPCCCISLQVGATITSAADMLFNSAYISRLLYVDWMVSRYRGYYPNSPTFYNSRVLEILLKYGGYSISGLSSLVLLGTILMLPQRVYPYVCYFWLVSRIVASVLQVGFVHQLIFSDIPMFINMGYEVLAVLPIHVFLSVLIFSFSKDAHDDYISKRKIAAADDEKDDDDVEDPEQDIRNSVTSNSSYCPAAPTPTTGFLAKRKAKLANHRSSLDNVTNTFYEQSNPTLFLSGKPRDYSIDSRRPTVAASFDLSTSLLDFYADAEEPPEDNDSWDDDVYSSHFRMKNGGDLGMKSVILSDLELNTLSRNNSLQHRQPGSLSQILSALSSKASSTKKSKK